MHIHTRAAVPWCLAALLFAPWAAAQTHGQPERFTAIAMATNELATGAGRVLIDVNRWSTESERVRLVKTLMEEGPKALLEELRDTRPVGRIRTPDSIGYDLHYAHQIPTEEGGRRIIIATDRPIGFWEEWHRPRTIDYPFTVIQLELGPEGRGSGTMSFATKIIAYDNTIELENFATSPIMLNEVVAEADQD